jgi:hypothetical protein
MKQRKDARLRAFFCFERTEGPVSGNHPGTIDPAREQKFQKLEQGALSLMRLAQPVRSQQEGDLT